MLHFLYVELVADLSQVGLQSSLVTPLRTLPVGSLLLLLVELGERMQVQQLLLDLHGLFVLDGHLQALPRLLPLLLSVDIFLDLGVVHANLTWHVRLLNSSGRPALDVHFGVLIVPLKLRGSVPDSERSELHLGRTRKRRRFEFLLWRHYTV